MCKIKMTDVAVENARRGSFELLEVAGSVRANIIRAFGDMLRNESCQSEILSENQIDLEEAKTLQLSASNLARLALSKEKLKSLSIAMLSLAEQEDPLGKIIRKTSLVDGLVLTQKAVPIGVILVIFESRPDVLPQIAALAIKSGNGLILKGGKEAKRTNEFILNLLGECIERISKGIVRRSLISLFSNRESVLEFLKMDHSIDLVIPRGSNELVQYVKANTKIPVLGHADGVCHVFVHRDANLKKAIRIIIDSKTNYPSACNAVETILVDSSVAHFCLTLANALQTRNVQIFAATSAAKYFAANGLHFPPPPSLHYEYGDLKVTIEIVEDLNHAILHINKYSSSHTECIITENDQVASIFEAKVDSACVFHNASTRFADGYRFGLGAEVGISTSRIHARGPVGVDGLLTTKWILRGSNNNDIVGDFGTRLAFSHVNLLSQL